MSENGKKVTGSPFFPHQLLREAFAGFLVLGILILLATYLPVPLLEEADPFITPSPIFPEWYFMPMFGVLKFWVWNIGPIPAKVIGIVLPGVVIGLIIALPFIDKNPERHPLKRPIATTLGIITIMVAISFAYYAIKITLLHAAVE
jgi:quinol-cytochrome oxidoreductase complex cytochrome b subunit